MMMLLPPFFLKFYRSQAVESLVTLQVNWLVFERFLLQSKTPKASSISPESSRLIYLVSWIETSPMLRNNLWFIILENLPVTVKS